MADGGRKGRAWSNEQWRRAYWVTWTAIGWLALGLGAVWLAQRLWTVVLPLALGLVIVVFLRPLVERLAARGAPRLVAVSLSYLVFASVLAGVVSLLVPVFAAQAEEFAASAPDLSGRLAELLAEAESRYEGLALPRWALRATDALAEGLIAQLADASREIPPRILAFGERAVGVLVGTVAGLVVGFYLLLTLPRVAPGILSAMPPGWRGDARQAGERLEDVVGGYIRGQALIAFLVGLLTWAGMAIAGLPFPALLGLVAGVGDIVPIVGPVLAAIIGAVIGVLVDPWLAVWAVVVVTAVQQIESAVLSPKILGTKLGLHPVIVILAVIAGTTLWGIAGLLLAVPLVGTAKTLWEYYAQRRGWRPVEGGTPESPDR
ncbi:MAG: AI-2E family transporter [Coriobacteriia bacterium]|nr:AI-2E family transporter [Coriobacteriia bacterium]